MKIQRVLLLISLWGVIPGVQAADWMAQEYPAKNFSEISVDGAAVIEITQGDTEYLRVEAEPEVMQRISVDLSGKRLTLGVKSKSGGFMTWFHNDNDEVRFILQVKTLSRLEISGAAQATIAALQQAGFVLEASGASHARFAALEGKIMAMNLSGASNAVVERVDAAQQTYSLSGAANLHINQESHAAQVKANVSGASNLHARPLKATSANVEASGAAKIDISVTENLTAEATGAANINYYGKPIAKTKTSGAGHINAQGE